MTFMSVDTACNNVFDVSVGLVKWKQCLNEEEKLGQHVCKK